MTRPKGQCIDGTLSSRRITMVPSRMPCLPLYHLLRLVNSLRYSRYHWLQNFCLSWWIRCQLDNRLGWVVLRSRSRMFVNVSSIKKCPGVRTGRSLGYVEMGVSGRKFNIASISITRVLRCSKVKSSVPTAQIRCRLNDFIAASYKPPKWCEFGGLNDHCICRSVRKVCIFSWWSSNCNRRWNSFNSLLAPT